MIRKFNLIYCHEEKLILLTNIHLIYKNFYITRWIRRRNPYKWWDLATVKITWQFVIFANKHIECAVFMPVRFIIDSDWYLLNVLTYGIRNATTNIHLNWIGFVYGFCSTREFFNHMETLPLPVKGWKCRPKLGTHGHWTVTVLERATTTVIWGIHL